MDGSIFQDPLPVAHWDMQEIKQRSQESVWAKKELLTRKKTIPRVKAEPDHSEGIQTFSRCVRVGLGKPEPTWS